MPDDLQRQQQRPRHDADVGRQDDVGGRPPRPRVDRSEQQPHQPAAAARPAARPRRPAAVCVGARIGAPIAITPITVGSGAALIHPVAPRLFGRAVPTPKTAGGGILSRAPRRQPDAARSTLVPRSSCPVPRPSSPLPRLRRPRRPAAGRRTASSRPGARRCSAWLAGARATGWSRSSVGRVRRPLPRARRSRRQSFAERCGQRHRPVEGCGRAPRARRLRRAADRAGPRHRPAVAPPLARPEAVSAATELRSRLGGSGPSRRPRARSARRTVARSDDAGPTLRVSTTLPLAAGWTATATPPRCQPVLGATADAARAHPGLRIEQSGDASLNAAINKTYGDDFSRAEVSSVPVTLIVLLVAFGALLAAAVPVRLGAHRRRRRDGPVRPDRHTSCPSTTPRVSVILLIGMAVGVDYSLFYLRREREERAAAATPDRDAVDRGRDPAATPCSSPA